MIPPTKPLTEQSIEELDISVGEVRTLRQRVSAEKQALQGMIGQINARCAVRLPQKEYQQLQRERATVVGQIAEKESELGALNAQMSEIQTVLEVRKRQAKQIQPREVSALVELRDRWHDYSMDAKNHQKAREVAWKVSQELRALLKPIFANES